MAADGYIRIDTRINSSGFNSGVRSMTGGLAKLRNGLRAVGVAAASAFLPLTIAAATLEVIRFGKESVKASTNLENATRGVQSIVEGQGRSLEQAKKFLNDYVSDGLVPMTNAATAYKNLAMRGYDNDQIAQTLTGLKNSAAYGRQASLSMGEAISSATEGLKNENSILVDNAGVTKNVSVMWKEYAKSIGVGVDSLTQQQKIQAEVNGIMRETRFQTGDAEKVASSFSGQLSQLSYHFNELKVAVGDTLIPLLKTLLPVIDRIVQGLTKFFQKLSKIVQKITGETSDWADNTSDASDAQDDLAASIDNASKAAKKALANFDNLNILQLGLSEETEAGKTDNITDNSLVNALGKGKDAFNDFRLNGVVPALGDINNFSYAYETVKEAVKEAIRIPTPVVAELPNPVFNPNWGLDLPKLTLPPFPVLPSPIFRPNWGLKPPPVTAPSFPTLPNPVFHPRWGLDVPKIPIPAFPILPFPIFRPNWGLEIPPITVPSFPMLPIPVFNPDWGLDLPKIPIPSFPLLPSPIFQPVWGLATALIPELEKVNKAVYDEVPVFQSVASAVSASLKYWPVAASAAAGSTQLMISSFASSTSGIMSSWGTNVMSNVRTTMQYIMDAAHTGLASSGNMFSDWVTQTSAAVAAWGNNISKNIGTVMRSAVKTIASGLKSAWDGFKSLAAAVGEKVSGWLGENKEVLIPSVLAAGLIVGVMGATVVLSGGVAIPAFAALAGAAATAAPAFLADGAVIPPNKKFMAVLGDQTSGVNIETPLSTMIEAFNTALDMRGSSAGGEITLKVIAGNRFVRDLKFEIEKQNGLSGVNLVKGGPIK